MEGLVPNCGIFAESKPRLGRMCNVPHLVNNSSSKIKICDTVAVTGETCLQLIPGLVVADYVR